MWTLLLGLLGCGGDGSATHAVPASSLAEERAPAHAEAATPLDQLEARLSGHGALLDPSESLQGVPEPLRALYEHPLMGPDLISIPARNGHDNEGYSRTFAFLPPSRVAILHGAYAQTLGKHWVPFGEVDAHDIALIDVRTNDVVQIAPDDFADGAALAAVLESSSSSFEAFIGRLQLQTVARFYEPDDSMRFDVVEIIDGTTVKYGFDYAFKDGSWGEESFNSPEAAEERYFELCYRSAAKQRTILAAPARFRSRFVDMGLRADP